MDTSKKPTDVSELEFIVGHYCKRVAEFLALCAAMVALQAFLTIFNPANPVDTFYPTPKSAKMAYIECVKSAGQLVGDEWQTEMRRCSELHKFLLERGIDLPEGFGRMAATREHKAP